MTGFMLALIFKYSMLYHVDARLATAVVQAESNFNAKAIGTKGELGLMQLRPELFPNFSRKQLVDVETNLKVGIKHLAEQMSKCSHQKSFTGVVCYNLGVEGGSRVKHPTLWPYYKNVMRAYASNEFNEIIWSVQ